MDITYLVVLVIALALFFDFTNGFHDTANAMATPIATGALKPKVAVALAAVLNLVGAFLSTEVAKTISGGLIKEGSGGVLISPEMIFAGLIGAIVWNMLTWLLGLPSSSSHALFGGLIGAALVGFGVGAIDGGVLLSKIILPALIAPFTAGLIAFVVTKLAYGLTRRYDKKPDGRSGFRYGQIFTSSLVALAHGTNDAQKTMGVITLTLVAVGMQDAGTGPQLWVVTVCALAIALGTYIGGWRIIKTLGRGLTEVKPAQGFAAEASTAATILASSHVGFALSTTQVASGSVIGSGLGRRGSEIRWGTVGRIGLGWLMTLPAAGAVGALAALVAQLGTVGVIADAVVGVGVILFIYLWSRRDEVGAHNAMSDVADSGHAVRITEPEKKVKRRDRVRQTAGSPGTETETGRQRGGGALPDSDATTTGDDK
ncbi:inorganic phosphate transporter [Mycetocola reblochoni]|uniref:Phosphate transporter n=2 Tax=Mycetocola reblochoni TaxID=331618 RepID=A0A1R4K8F2_9MICO|nr:inorganic phosphate transporter [Mycetocola reblochoni]RLP68079.1 inorganic phosphate transporter [Mycetocola reblochoni]SJN40600.1 Probable low-affinity inorganic phosphate transporter [Mycetocola reblochoni REB411]